VDVCYDPDYDTSHDEPDRQTAAQVLTAVLRRVGAGQSAHVSIRQAHEAAESIATLAAEYHTIARAAQEQRWTALLTASGLAADQLAQARRSGAFGALLVALGDADAQGFNLDSALPLLVRGRTLIGVDDVASVLHGRVRRWIEANETSCRPTAGKLIAGFLPAALNVTDSDMRQAMTERAQAIETRAKMLAARALDRSETWTCSLGPPPADPRLRQAWMTQLAIIAAYRDHWDDCSLAPVGATDECSLNQRRHANQARQAIQRARTIVQDAYQDRAVTSRVETAVMSQERPAL
jgi:hypothetical protein